MVILPIDSEPFATLQNSSQIVMLDSEKEALVRQSCAGHSPERGHFMVVCLSNTPVDRGCAQGVAGREMRPKDPYTPERMGTGPVYGTAGGVINTHRGPVIAFFHNYLIMPKAATVHSVIAMEEDGHTVFDTAYHAGGKQHIVHKKEFFIPLNFLNGVAQLPMRPYTDEEFDELPQLYFTEQAHHGLGHLNYDMAYQTNWFRDHILVFTHPRPKKRKTREETI
jgi:hypothetical protein